jgi:acylphosphatase
LTKIRLQIHGKVQGVFYRQSALEVAKILGLSGWIKNNPDGTVEAEAVGSPEALAKFKEWCQNGPPRAVIDRVETLGEEELAAPPSDVRGFRIVG